ncbi:ligase-associated DNA damage response endonuclease PdeM [Alsobacter sp. R-9]
MSVARDERRDAAATVVVGGIAFVADPAGALVQQEESLLLVADLHLEKGSAFARRGVFLPPYDSRATLAALADALTRWQPRRVAVLGDTLHDAAAMARIDRGDLATLASLQAGRDWLWLTGNHDPQLPRDLGGTVLAQLAIAGVTLRHEPSARETGAEIAGHLHPAGKVRGGGRSLRRRCFAADGRRCVLPAFGAYAGGLNVLDPAFRPLFPGPFTAHVLGSGRVYAVPSSALAPD